MRLMDQTPRAFAIRTLLTSLVASVMVGVAVRVASAREGVVGTARSFVSVAGTLTGPGMTPGSTVPVSFEFQRSDDGGAPLAVCAPVVMVVIQAGGAFSAQVDIGSPCPDNLFDGRNVLVRALVAGSEVAAPAPVNPVPYAQFASTAGVARQYGTPDCPVGYERNLSDATITADMRLCQRAHQDGTSRVIDDEVVRIGSGPSAFWIDRFEATVWPSRSGAPPASPYGCTQRYPTEFRANGQWATEVVRTVPVIAASRRGFDPSACITWFQANEACRAAGKRLPTGGEWLAAAQGTPDPGMGDLCRIGGGSVGGTRSASVSGCVSVWGAQDMVGNVAEWTDEWYATIQTTSTPVVSGSWDPGGGSDYNQDDTYGITSVVTHPPGRNAGLPAAVFRGGDWTDGIHAGIFTMHAYFSPGGVSGYVGFRCVIPR